MVTNCPDAVHALVHRLISVPASTRSDKGRFHTMLDVLTANAAKYRCTIFFLPLPREVLEGKIKLDEKDMAIVKAELYSKIYQSVGSLLLAILNVEAVRRMRESMKLIDAANEAYLRNLQKPYAMPEKDFETAVATAKQIMVDVDMLITEMEKDPLNYELSKKLALKCEEFRNSTLRIRDSRFASGRKLVRLLPIYSLSLDRADFNGVDEIIRAFNSDSLGLPINDATHNPRLRGGVEHFDFNLQSSARRSQFFSPMVPSNIPGNIDPIAFHLTSENAPTHFAPLFAVIEENLLTHFDAIKLTGDDGRKVLVFCPSTALRGSATAGLLQ